MKTSGIETDYPMVGYYFRVAISGSNTNGDASFREVSGLTPEMVMVAEDVYGERRYQNNTPMVTRHTNLILKRGLIIANSELAGWCRNAIMSDVSSAIAPKDISVALLDADVKPLMAWRFVNAWPVKFTLSDAQTDDGALMVESMEFAYRFFEREII